MIVYGSEYSYFTGKLEAYLTVGDIGTARELFECAQQMRLDDGRYWTGTVFPEAVNFPENETSSYTAAAVVLAADALAGTNPGSTLFTTLGFAGLYLVLGVLFLFLVAREVGHGPRAPHGAGATAAAGH